MQELQYLANWVKEQHAQEYILTWLLNQPGLWWSDGEAYEAATQKSGRLLREYVQKNQAGDLFQGIADKIVGDDSWDEVAISLAKIISIYQEELVRLQDYSRKRSALRRKPPTPPVAGNTPELLPVQQALPDPYTDPLMGDKSAR
jgi:hypothetical protein